MQVASWQLHCMAGFWLLRHLSFASWHLSACISARTKILVDMVVVNVSSLVRCMVLVGNVQGKGRRRWYI